MNRTFCAKCGNRAEGGTGSGRQYRCPRCSDLRLAALLARRRGQANPTDEKRRM